jgi:hypothetical protein
MHSAAAFLCDERGVRGRFIGDFAAARHHYRGALPRPRGELPQAIVVSIWIGGPAEDRPWLEERGMAPTIALRGLFDAEPKRLLEPASWYVGFACQNCGRLFAFLDDPTNSGTIAIEGDATLRIMCPGCGEEYDYPAENALVFQSTTGSSTVPPAV